jgi:hypothetical protein
LLKNGVLTQPLLQFRTTAIAKNNGVLRRELSIPQKQVHYFLLLYYFAAKALSKCRFLTSFSGLLYWHYPLFPSIKIKWP